MQVQEDNVRFEQGLQTTHDKSIRPPWSIRSNVRTPTTAELQRMAETSLRMLQWALIAGQQHHRSGHIKLVTVSFSQHGLLENW